MTQVPPIEIVRQFANTYRDRLLWIEDIKSFAMYDIELKYYEILDLKKMTWLMNNFVYEQTEKSYSDSTIRGSYLAFLTFESFRSIPSVFCSDLEFEKRYNHIAFKDKLLNLDSFEWEEQTPDIYCFHRVPFTYDSIQDAEAPRWLQFLDEVIVQENDHTKPDKEMQKLLQHMMGYCMANTIKAQKAFFLFGASRAGKGVIASILQTLMGGSKFISNNKLGTLTAGSFALSSLVGKKANIAGEEESAQIPADIFKELVSGDTITADKKFQDNFSFTPQIKLIMLANKSLKFKYIDDAIRERLITIPFFKTIPENERDLDLIRKLHGELPGIMKWVLEGLKELIDNSYKFSKPQASKDAMKRIESDVSNAILFFTENYEIDETEASFISSQDLYEAYRSWCNSTGHRGVMANIKFHAEIESIRDDISKSRKRINGSSIRGYFIKKKDGSYVEEMDSLFS